MESSIIRSVISVAGMSCHGCVKNVTEGLAALPGVRDVEVSLAAGQASVLYDAALIDAARLRQTIEALGFDVG